jgi:hypothetical protein
MLVRKPLQAIVRMALGTALDGGTAAMKMLEGRRLLEAVGARRRRPSAMAMAGAGLGAVGVLAAGSALTVWLSHHRTIPSQSHRNGAIPKSPSDALESASTASHL